MTARNPAPCALCKHNPAHGYASVWGGNHKGNLRLCHTDDHSCYVAWTVYEVREDGEDLGHVHAIWNRYVETDGGNEMTYPSEFVPSSGLREEVDAAFEALGPRGRLLSGSKSAYTANHPGEQPFFNANVFLKTKDGWTKVWFGDLLPHGADKQKLQRIADALGTVAVTHEHAGRFEKERDPDLSEAAFFYKEGTHEREF